MIVWGLKETTAAARVSTLLWQTTPIDDFPPKGRRIYRPTPQALPLCNLPPDEPDLRADASRVPGRQRILCVPGPACVARREVESPHQLLQGLENVTPAHELCRVLGAQLRVGLVFFLGGGSRGAHAGMTHDSEPHPAYRALRMSASSAFSWRILATPRGQLRTLRPPSPGQRWSGRRRGSWQWPPRRRGRPQRRTARGPGAAPSPRRWGSSAPETPPRAASRPRRGRARWPASRQTGAAGSRDRLWGGRRRVTTERGRGSRETQQRHARSTPPGRSYRARRSRPPWTRPCRPWRPAPARLPAQTRPCSRPLSAG